MFEESPSTLYLQDNYTWIHYGTFLIFFLAQRLLLSLVSMSTSEVPSPSWQISGSLWVPKGHASWNTLHGCSCEYWWCIFWSLPRWWQNSPSHHSSLQGAILRGPSWKGNHSVDFLWEGVTHNQKTEIWLLEKE